MRRIVVAAIVLFGSSGIALAEDGGEFVEFWSALFWNVLNFIAGSGGIWQL